MLTNHEIAIYKNNLYVNFLMCTPKNLKIFVSSLLFVFKFKNAFVNKKRFKINLLKLFLCCIKV